MSIKPLLWEINHGQRIRQRAMTPFGYYEIRSKGTAYQCCFYFLGQGEWQELVELPLSESIEQAKAVAEADWVSLLKECLLED